MADCLSGEGDATCTAEDSIDSGALAHDNSVTMNPPTHAFLVAWTTHPDERGAQTLAQEAVGEGLAACVQVEGPVTSHYRWQGRLERSLEWRLTFKLPVSAEPALRVWVHARHPYEIPEWICVPALAVSGAYGDWLRESVSNGGQAEA